MYISRVLLYTNTYIAIFKFKFCLNFFYIFNYTNIRIITYVFQLIHILIHIS